ncbi:MAG TPA: penicillin-binding protein 2 [Opitutaceae bacterium]|nr:penicillin-binding protein 2 [Opitutaceae bacterium]
MSKGFASSYRIVLLAGALFACFGGLATRLVCLHVVDRDTWLPRIEKTRQQFTEKKARRGDIYSWDTFNKTRGVVLATSRPMIALRVDPQALVETPKEMRKWPQLAELIGMPEPELRKIFTTKFRMPAPTNPAPAASSATEHAGLVFNFEFAKPAAAAETAPASTDAEDDGDTELAADADAQGRRAIHYAKLREEIPESVFEQIGQLNLTGLIGERVYRRAYPNNQLAAHLLGYVNREERPLAGVEFYTDFYLRGQNGWQEGERDGRGRPLAQFNTRDVPKADGYSVTLSIDAKVQDIIEQELDFIGKKFQPQKATIVVSDPRTGFILGMANYPTFNPNEYNLVPKDEQARMKNVAVTDEYEPGSVFKIVAASAAIEEGVVDDRSRFDCMLEKIDYKGRTRKLPRDDHRYDHDLSVAEIISHSSNRGAAQLAMRVGDEKYYRYVRAFGFGGKLGFPIGGEVTGTVHKFDSRDWDITRVPMGQAVTATVLQMHQAMSTIASGGILYRPQIIREIDAASGEHVYHYEKVELGRAISARTAQTMAQLLMGVASSEGTAPEAAIRLGGVDYEVAGKTGTAQKYIDGKPSDKHHVASFVGFFPALPRPGEQQVAISVIVDDADAHAPNGVAYGKTVAAPSFRHIGEQLIPILDIKAPGQPTRALTFAAATEGGRR